MGQNTVMSPDLFGGMSPLQLNHGPFGTFQRRKMALNYRPAEDPKTASCKLCVCKFRKEGGRRNYNKCGLIGCSDSMSTDISLRYVCDKFHRMGA